MDSSTSTTADAAAVPSSFTSAQVLWKTPEIYSSFVPSIPEKSASGPKALDMPMLASVALRSKLDSSLKVGKKISTGCSFIRASVREIRLGLRRYSKAPQPSIWRGKKQPIAGLPHLPKLFTVPPLAWSEFR